MATEQNKDDEARILNKKNRLDLISYISDDNLDIQEEYRHPDSIIIFLKTKGYVSRDEYIASRSESDSDIRHQSNTTILLSYSMDEKGNDKLKYSCKNQYGTPYDYLPDLEYESSSNNDNNKTVIHVRILSHLLSIVVYNDLPIDDVIIPMSEILLIKRQ